MATVEHLVLQVEDEHVDGCASCAPEPSNGLLTNEERTMLERVDGEPFASWADRLRSGAGAGRQPRILKESLYGTDKARSCTYVDSLGADLRARRVPVADVLHTERFEKHFLTPAVESAQVGPRNANAPPTVNTVRVRIDQFQCAKLSSVGAQAGEATGGHVSLEVVRRPDYVPAAGSDATSEAELDFEVPMPEPPDGEFGWVVVMAAFVCSFISSGVQDTFGLVLSHLVKSFDSSTTSSSIAGSIFWGLPMLLCPLSSALTNRFGCRAVTIAAGLVTFVGLFLSAFMPTIELFYLTYGVVAGVGFALVYIPSTVIVSFYFEQRRAFATGLSAAGSGFGIVVFGLITETLFERYGVSGYLMIIAAFSLNIAAFGLFFRPLESRRERRERVRLMHMEQLGHRLVADPASLQHSMRSVSYLQGDVPTKIQLLERLFSPQSLAPPETETRLEASNAIAESASAPEPTPAFMSAPTIDTHRLSSAFRQLSTLSSIPELDERLLRSALNLSASMAPTAASASARLHRSTSVPLESINGDCGSSADCVRPSCCGCGESKSKVLSNYASTSRELSPARVPLSDALAKVLLPQAAASSATAPRAPAGQVGGKQSKRSHEQPPRPLLLPISLPPPPPPPQPQLQARLQPLPQAQRAHHSSHSKHAHPHAHHREKEKPPMPPTVWLRVGGRRPIALPGDLFSRAILAPMCRRDILYRGTLERVPELRVCTMESCPELFKSARSPSTVSLRTGSGSSGSLAAGCARARDACARLLALLGSFVDLRVFGNRMFLLYFVSSVSVSLFQTVPCFFLTEFARSNAVNELGIQWLYLIMGVCTSLGQIVIGYIGDRPQVNTLVLHASTLLICGISTTLLPPLISFASAFASSYSNPNANLDVNLNAHLNANLNAHLSANLNAHLNASTLLQTTAAAAAASGGVLQQMQTSAVATATGAQWVWAPFVVLTLFQLFFNFFIAGQSALSTLLIVEFLSLEELTSACALIWCGDGVALIVGPPLLSLLAERSGNYNSTFIISGLALLFFSMLLLVSAVPSIRLRLDTNYARELLESDADADAGASTPDADADEEELPLEQVVAMRNKNENDNASSVWSRAAPRSPATRFTEMSDVDSADTDLNDADPDAEADASSSDRLSVTDHSNLTPEKTLSSSKY